MLFSSPSRAGARSGARNGAATERSSALAGFYSGAPTTPGAGGRPDAPKQPETIDIFTKDGVRTIRYGMGACFML